MTEHARELIMRKYRKLLSDFTKETKTGVVGYIVRGSLIVYALVLFSTPLTIGKLPVLTPEQIFFLVLTYAVFVGKGVGFIRDLAPLVILFFAYEAMRGVVIAGEQRVITDYRSTTQSFDGISVTTVPKLVNLGEPFIIQVKADPGVEEVTIFAEGRMVSSIKLDEGEGNFSVDEKTSMNFFGEEGVHNITATASENNEINGSCVIGITRNVHYREPIEWERGVFGFIPSAYLQAQLYKEGTASLIDIVSVIAYSVHFLIPFGFACLVWFKDRELYKRYSTAFLILTYAGLITFLIYPAAPPWLADRVGYLNGVRKVYQETSEALHLVLLPSLYYWINANEVAAIPSLHAAYPLLISIFSVRLWGRKGLLVFLYPAITAFSLIYLGEHYGVDILVGCVYVIGALLATELIFRKVVA